MSNPVKPIGETQSFHLHLTDVRVVHLHELRSEAVVVFTLRYEEDGEEFPGSVTLPLSRVGQLKLQVGDELTLLTQKTKSMYHEAKK
jgi:hypothetical protein